MERGWWLGGCEVITHTLYDLNLTEVERWKQGRDTGNIPMLEATGEWLIGYVAKKRKGVGITSSPSFRANDLASHLSGSKWEESKGISCNPLPSDPPSPQHLCPSTLPGHHSSNSPLPSKSSVFPSAESFSTTFSFFLLS